MLGYFLPHKFCHHLSRPIIKDNNSRLAEMIHSIKDIRGGKRPNVWWLLQVLGLIFKAHIIDL